MTSNRLLMATALLTASLLTACGTTDSYEQSPSDSGVEQESSTGELHKMGEAIDAPGATVTLQKVTESDSLEVYADNYKRGTMPNETLTPENQGAKYVSVETTVKNTSKKSMDLTCGFGLQATLFNKDEQAYDPIDSLYRVLDNPECNESLNPGFEKTMTWVYEVPADMQPYAFGVAEPTEHFGDYTYFDASQVG